MSFTAIKTEGGLLPREVLERIAAGDPDLPGTGQDTYHIPPNERIGERINRAWNRLLGLWEAYSHDLKARGEGDAATGLTRDRWLLPLFDEFGFGRLQRSTAIQIERKSFAISHMWERTPIHLVGAGVSIDRRVAGVAGAAAAAPHGLVQEFLNRSDAHLWAFVSNGRLLRILRDNHSLSRQAYVEFDLEAIMNGELFSDFRVLWLVCHQSRVEAEKPEECWLETWFQKSREEGVRALDALRVGVEKAIEAFGAGFLRHPANGRLHEGFRWGALYRQDYYRELLRLVYRLIFLFVAEDRDALLDPNASQEARQRYTKFYASTRLRELAGRRRGTAHDDLWRGLRLVLSKLHDGSPELGLPALGSFLWSEEAVEWIGDAELRNDDLWRGLRLVLSKLHDGSPELGLPALGSFLWSEEAVEWIGDAELRNDDLLGAFRALCYTTQDHQLLPVNWRTLGSEELGSVYESLLELHPKMNREAGTFELDTAAGHERKTTGSYYTPTSLVDRLLDSALEPVLAEAMSADDPEAALLDLKVCDTAAGSGHFLVAAARRIALRLASVRTGDEEASPEAVTHAVRDVVGRCIYGVDLNPLAVELCKVSLWMEALEPGKPLSFLDHHVQVGNSVIGTTPSLLAMGVPDEAFSPTSDDSTQYVRLLRERNKEQRETGQIGFHVKLVAEGKPQYGGLDGALAELDRTDDSSLAGIRAKEKAYRRIVDHPTLRRRRIVADAWCAAFMAEKPAGTNEIVTEDIYRQLEAHEEDGTVPQRIIDAIDTVSKKHRFFHYHLGFPDFFAGPESERNRREGFDVLLGNPPYLRPHHVPDRWKPLLWYRFESYEKKADLYVCFVELALQLVREGGRVGYVLSSSWLRLDSFQRFRERLLRECTVVRIDDYRYPVFEGVGVKTTLLVAERTQPAANHEVVITLHKGRSEEPDERKVPQAHFGVTYGSIFDTEMDPTAERVKGKIRAAGKPLGDLFELGFGMKTGDDAFFIGTEKRTPDHRPVLRGADVGRYRIDFAGEYVWYVPDQMKQRKRTARPGTAARFEQPKILVRDTGGGLEAAFDEQGYFVKDMLLVMSCDQNAQALAYTAGLLNSRLMRFYYESSFPTLHVQRNELASLPIPPYHGSAKQVAIANKVRKIQGSGVEADANVPCDRELDELAYDEYGLSDSDRTVVEAWFGSAD
jgi:hypothetical protein